MRRHRWVLVLCWAAVACRARAPVTPHADVRLDSLNDKRAAFAQAYDRFRRGDVQQALPVFTALAGAYPQLADYHLYFIGVIQARLGDDAAAEAALRRMLREYPQSVKAPAAELELGKVLQRTNRLDQARTPLQAALSAPDSSTAQAARLALAEVDEESGDIHAAYAGFMQVRRSAIGSAAARTAKQRALALRAQHPELAPEGTDRLDDARLLLAEHDYAAVERAAEDLQEHPDGVDPADTLRLRADALYGQGQAEGAVATLRELVDHYPSSAAAPPALFRLASIRWNRDNDAAALQAFDEFRSRYPGDPQADEVLYAVGRIHEGAGRTGAAITTYTELVRSHPGSKLAGEAQWRVGWIRYGARDWPGAVASFEQLASVDVSTPQRNGARYWQARALERDARAGQAKTLYQQIVAETPTDYYAMWAQQRLEGGLPESMRLPPIGMEAGMLAAVEEDAPQTPPAEPMTQGAAAGPDAFHLARAAELKAAGPKELARDELATIERQNQNDTAILRYLLHAYQGVDGYANAVRLLRRLGDSADLPTAERERFLYPPAFWTIVRRAADANGVDPFLVEAVMRQESLFDPAARSPADAWGLMQLLPSTARRVATTSGDPPVDPTDLTRPETNIQLGVRYLRTLLDRFGDDPLKAVAAYNGGEASVEKWERRFPDLEGDEFVESISFRETRDYVKRVVTNYRAYRQIYSGSPTGRT